MKPAAVSLLLVMSILLVPWTSSLIVDEAEAEVSVTQDSVLRDPSAAANDMFGYDVVTSGDIMVTSALSSMQGSNESQGSVFVYERNQSSGGWDLVREITSSNGAAWDQYGSALALDGDTLVVGVGGHDSQNGAVYIYERNHTGQNAWGERTVLTNANGAQGAQFGWDVALDGDDLIVGEPFFGESPLIGQVSLFNRDQGGSDAWGLVRNWSASDAVDSDEFGFSVDIDGDTIAVGASHQYTFVDAGRVYVYGRDQGGQGTWGEVTILNDTVNGVAGDMFGGVVSLDGGILAVGAIYHNSNGSVYVYNESLGGAGNWGLEAQLQNTSTYEFGTSVALSNGLLAVGAPSTEPGVAQVHSVHEGGANNWGAIASFNAGTGATWDMFGQSVAFNGDQLLVGAPGEDHGQTVSAGSLYLYDIGEQAPLGISNPNSDATLAEDSPYPGHLYQGTGIDTWSIAPSDSFLAIDPLSGAVSGMPDNSHVGTHAFTVTGMASGGGMVEDSFSVNVTNVDPMIYTPATNATLSLGIVYQQFFGSDDDGQGNVSWSATTNASWLSFNATSQVLRGTVAESGTFGVSVNVDDGNSGEDWLNYTLFVNGTPPVNDDRDGDGVNNSVDNCPDDANPGQNDTDVDLIGDACDNDIDNDGVPNVNDNCEFVGNADQADLDNDALGNLCDDDRDGDGANNTADNCPDVSNANQVDIDEDDIGDACDPLIFADLDGDGVENSVDQCPNGASGWQSVNLSLSPSLSLHEIGEDPRFSLPEFDYFGTLGEADNTYYLEFEEWDEEEETDIYREVRVMWITFDEDGDAVFNIDPDFMANKSTHNPDETYDGPLTVYTQTDYDGDGCRDHDEDDNDDNDAILDEDDFCPREYGMAAAGIHIWTIIDYEAKGSSEYREGTTPKPYELNKTFGAGCVDTDGDTVPDVLDRYPNNATYVERQQDCGSPTSIVSGNTIHVIKDGARDDDDDDEDGDTTSLFVDEDGRYRGHLDNVADYAEIEEDEDDDSPLDLLVWSILGLVLVGVIQRPRKTVDDDEE